MVFAVDRRHYACTSSRRLKVLGDEVRYPSGVENAPHTDDPCRGNRIDTAIESWSCRRRVGDTIRMQSGTVHDMPDDAAKSSRGHHQVVA